VRAETNWSLLTRVWGGSSKLSPTGWDWDLTKIARGRQWRQSLIRKIVRKEFEEANQNYHLLGQMRLNWAKLKIVIGSQWRQSPISKNRKRVIKLKALLAEGFLFGAIESNSWNLQIEFFWGWGKKFSDVKKFFVGTYLSKFQIVGRILAFPANWTSLVILKAKFVDTEKISLIIS